jgi:hypothetical protein
LLDEGKVKPLVLAAVPEPEAGGVYTERQLRQIRVNNRRVDRYLTQIIGTPPKLD